MKEIFVFISNRKFSLALKGVRKPLMTCFHIKSKDANIFSIYRNTTDPSQEITASVIKKTNGVIDGRILNNEGIFLASVHSFHSKYGWNIHFNDRDGKVIVETLSTNKHFDHEINRTIILRAASSSGYSISITRPSLSDVLGIFIHPNRRLYGFANNPLSINDLFLYLSLAIFEVIYGSREPSYGGV